MNAEDGRGDQHGKISFFTTILTVFAVLVFLPVACIFEMLGLIDHADLEEAVEEFTDD